MDRVADNGLRYTRFHTTALCSPTRAALLTGRNHHSVGTGVIGEAGTGFPGYDGIIPNSAATFAEVLREYGYMNAWFGKNHNVPDWETSLVGPFDRWSDGLGFDYFYGFVGGDTDQYSPALVENKKRIEPPETNEDGSPYHFTTDIADHAIRTIRAAKAVAPQRPFFLYFATGATHAPHQVPEEWIAKFKGQFDMGWDEYREQTFARQKELGVVPQDAKLTPRPDSLPAWDSLPEDERKVYARMMEVFAAFTAHTDHEVGRVIDAIEQAGELDNTLILYMAGDNGSSAEGGLNGLLNEMTFFNGIPEPLDTKLAAHRHPRRPDSTTTTSPPPGPGRWTRRSSGPSRSPATSAAPATAWRSPGRRGSRPAARSATSSTTSSTSPRRSSKSSASSSPRSSTASRRSRSRASAWPTPSTTPTPRTAAPPSTSRCSATRASTTTAGWPAPSEASPG